MLVLLGWMFLFYKKGLQDGSGRIYSIIFFPLCRVSLDYRGGEKLKNNIGLNSQRKLNPVALRHTLSYCF